MLPLTVYGRGTCKLPCDAHLSVNFHEPPADLEGYFTTFYYVETTVPDGERITDSLHPEWAGVRIISGSLPDCTITGEDTLSGSDCIVTGPSSLPLQFSASSTRMWGIGLLPLGWATFIGEPADRFANTVNDAGSVDTFAHFGDLAKLLLAEGMAETEQLAAIHHFFRETAPRHGKEDPRIGIIHAALVEPELPQVSEMADRCGINQRTLERLCRRHFGFSPKVLLRRQRFMRSLAQFMLDPSLGWIGAIDSLYFDQSHFVRDCKKFLGVSPSEYMAMDHPVITGFMRERMRAHGSAVQTLDQPDCGRDGAQGQTG